jgi:serine/threonine-protein kinase TTK/MPS1
MFMVNKKSYLKLECIGSGGSAKVFKVLSKDKQILALKKIMLDSDDSAGGHVANYRSEIDLLRSFRGKRYCIQLIDHEEALHENAIYMVMELGQLDLAQIIKQARTNGTELAPSSVRHYWHEILNCVRACHLDKVIHLDLKPANFVFVDGIIKIIDFGIAKQADSNTTNILRDSQVGTVSYMSPESIMAGQGEGKAQFKLGRSADIWSLGCILYELVYGHTPFHQKSLIQKIHAITDPGFAVPFPELSPGYPDILLLVDK